MLIKRSQNKSLGEKGEDIACELLKKAGYKILQRNFSGKFGEIDIIAISGDTLVFIEVKTRKSLRFGMPEEAVTPAKLGKIKKTAEYYSLLHPNFPKKLRINVVGLILSDNAIAYSKIIKVY